MQSRTGDSASIKTEHPLSNGKDMFFVVVHEAASVQHTYLNFDLASPGKLTEPPKGRCELGSADFAIDICVRSRPSPYRK